MALSKTLQLTKTVSIPLNEYERLKAIEQTFQKEFDIVPLFFNSERFTDYTHKARIKKSLSKAMKKYPPIVWK
ncbi:MAG: hypothetical protein AAB400_04555 [Patescibacteria group bacterium]